MDSYEIAAVTDSFGYSARLVILPGQTHDLVEMPRLMDGLLFGALASDPAFDAGLLLKELEERGSEAVITPSGSAAGSGLGPRSV